jgi:uncharacterized membrane protein
MEEKNNGKNNGKQVEKKQPNIKSKKSSKGQKAADWLAKWAGSWSFIALFMTFLFVWMILNTFLIVFGTWDLYPFILLNLILSCIAAIQAPIILMSQNRQSEVDRQRAQYDYLVDRKAEREIKQIQLDVLEMKEAILKQSTKAQASHLREEIKKIQEELNKLHNKMKK